MAKQRTTVTYFNFYFSNELQIDFVNIWLNYN